MRVPFVSRPMMFALAAILAAVNARAPVILTDLDTNGWLVALTRLFGVSAIFWFACYALWALASRKDALSRGTWSDLVVVSGLVAIAMSPFSAASALALTGGAVWLTYSSSSGSADRAVGIVMLGMAAHLVLAPIILTVFGPFILAVDTQFAAIFAGTAAEGNVLAFRGAPGGVVVFGGCSSIGNMSLCVLMWVVLVQLLGVKVDRRLLGYALASMAALFTINTVRLVSFVWFPDHVDVIHHGYIAEIFGWTSLIVMAAIAGAGVIDANRRHA